MKLQLLFASGLLIVALSSCQKSDTGSTSPSRGSVQIDEHSVLIPGTTISDDDQEALNKIFGKYDSSLYRIAVYENGSLKKQIGTMDEMQTAEVVKEYSGSAKASGLTSWTNLIANPNHVTHLGNTTHVTTAGTPSHVTTVGRPSHVTKIEYTTHVTRASDESDALVKEVTPILERYSK